MAFASVCFLVLHRMVCSQYGNAVGIVGVVRVSKSVGLSPNSAEFCPTFRHLTRFEDGHDEQFERAIMYLLVEVGHGVTFYPGSVVMSLMRSLEFCLMLCKSVRCFPWMDAWME
jgi:hypothetical protein